MGPGQTSRAWYFYSPDSDFFLYLDLWNMLSLAYPSVLQQFQQHDVQELNRILFTAIESSLVGTSGKDIINKLYHGRLANKVRLHYL